LTDYVAAGPGTGALVLRPEGALDSEGVAAVRDPLERVVRRGRDVEIDLSRVASLDGAGVGAMAHAFRHLAASGRHLRVTGASGQPEELLRELGILRVLTGRGPRTTGGCA
jgi:anti-anti-sigma factor